MRSERGQIIVGIVMVVGFLTALLLLGWFLAMNDLAMAKFFNPKYEQVRRETFEQSKAYNQGMIQELQNMQFEYIKAAPEHRAALKSIILHRAADYNEVLLPYDLRQFLQQIKNESEINK